MKFKTILIVLLISACFKSFSQVKRISDFEKLKNYFLENHEDGFSKDINTIPLDLARSVLGKSIIDSNVVSVYPIAKYNKLKNIILILELGYPQGGNVSSFKIINFSSIGKILEYAEMGYNMLDLEGGDFCGLSFVNDSIIEVETGDESVDKVGKDTLTNLKYSYYFIGDSGYRILELSNPSKGRLFPEVSKRILDYSELIKYSKSDLDIMRNEIFADYGYIFKTKRWNGYFSEKIWYKPCKKNVNDSLTLIENINIANILKVTANR